MSIQLDLPHFEASQWLRTRLHQLAAAHREHSSELGELFAVLEEKAYWREWGYPDFQSCIEKEFTIKPSTTRQLLKVHRTLVGRLGLPPERARQFEWSKVALVTAVLTPENAGAVLGDVEKLSYRELKLKYQPPKRPPTPKVPSDPPPRTAAPGPLPSADWRRPRPPEDEFYVGVAEWEQLCYALHHGEHALLKGHSGCGKTELCVRVARAFEKELVSLNCGGMTEPRSALIGNTHLDRETGTWFQPSRFVGAVQNGRSCILLDELSRAPRDAFNLLFPVLDRQRYLALDESRDAALVSVDPGITFLATANLGAGYTGADQLDLALLDRFPVVLEMDFPPAAQEATILVKQCPGLSERDAQHLVRFAGRQREMAREGEFTAFLSTRTLLAAGRQAAAGVTLANTIRFCVLNRFTDEGGDVSERTRLLQILQMLMG